MGACRVLNTYIVSQRSGGISRKLGKGYFGHRREANWSLLHEGAIVSPATVTDVPPGRPVNNSQVACTFCGVTQPGLSTIEYLLGV